MSRPDLSVVLLCYRLGESARAQVAAMRSVLETSVPNYELVLVGNYRSDDDVTPHVVTDIALGDPRTKVTARKKEGMMGWDMRTGLALATGNHIAVIDGDGQMPFEDVTRVFEALKKNGADMAKTYRTVRGDDVWRTVVSIVYNLLFRILFPGVRVRDVNSKPKIFTRAAYERLALTSDDWFIDAEMLIQARRLSFRLIEVPTVFNKLEGRQSFVKPRTILEFLWNFVIYRVKEFFI
jgi:glycosyltransferase involved in cell wall biosynthesis